MKKLMVRIDQLKKTPPGQLFVKMGEDNAFNWAVIIAWNFLQSLFPIALVMAALLGVGLAYVGVGSHQVYGTVASIIPDTNAQKEVLATLNTFQQKSGIFFLIGFAGLIWSGASLFRTMEQAFAVIYHTRQRPLIKGIFMSVGMVLLLTLFGGLMLVSTTVFGLLNQLPYLPTVLANGMFDFVLQVALGLGTGFLLFMAIYYVVPNRRLGLGERMDWSRPGWRSLRSPVAHLSALPEADRRRLDLWQDVRHPLPANDLFLSPRQCDHGWGRG